MTPNVAQVAVALLVTFASPAAAFWRLPCNAPIVAQRADPIVDPGAVAGHVHHILGGSGFGFDMNYDDTQKSTCSSCMVTKDFSNYWVPQLYYKAQNGTFISVKPNGGATVYYLQRSDEKDPEYANGLLAFPEGFRMLAGTSTLRNYTDTVEQQAISYACLGVSGPETNEFPKQNCPGGLRSQVFFPSCWDGQNLDSPDHKSHMAYPSQYNSGFCPPSHPKRFISIFYEVIWNTPDFADMWYNGQQPFVWSMGDDTGYGYHGDFVNGWDVPTLQKAVTECTANSGNIKDCPVFDFFTDDVTNGCKIPASIDEQVFGVLDTLPGCNPVQSGPAMAKTIKGCGAPTTIGTPEYNFVDMTVSKGFAYIGCGIDIAGQPRSLQGDSWVADDMTNEKCVDHCISKGFSIAGTEYSTECYCGNSILDGRAPVAGLMGNCMMPCGGDSSEYCGGGGQISMYQKCTGTCRNVVFTVNNSTSSGTPSYGSSPGSTSSAAPDSPSTGSGSSSTSAVATSAGGEAATSTPSTPSSTSGADDYSQHHTDTDGSQAAPSDVVVVHQTMTVVPLASYPGPVPPLTVTVTVCGSSTIMPAPSRPAAASNSLVPVAKGNPSVSTPPQASPSAAVSYPPPPPPPSPTATLTSAPFAYHNATSLTSAQSSASSMGLRHHHAHAQHKHLY